MVAQVVAVGFLATQEAEKITLTDRMQMHSGFSLMSNQSNGHSGKAFGFVFWIRSFYFSYKEALHRDCNEKLALKKQIVDRK